jgi:hypothetical protein
MTLINITHDFQYANWGWVMEVHCGYPEARLTGEIYMKNNTSYESGFRLSAMTNGYMSYTGPGNLTIID